MNSSSSLPSGWVNASINDLKGDEKTAIAIGPFGSRMKSDCYVESGIPVIRGTNLTGGRVFEGEFVYITKEKANELGGANVYKHDLVFPHRGAIGEVGIISEDRRYVLSTSLMKLTPNRKKADSLFLFYFFKSKIGRYELLKNASQVGTPGIGQPLTSLKSIRLNLPPIDEQKEIAKILGSLDDKIELNRQINQTLEEMAQAIFKSWFVDFEPVKAKIEAKANGQDPELAAMCAISGKTDAELDQLPPDQLAQLRTTAALFPNELTDSELGLIPKGWEIKSLSDISKFATGKTDVSALGIENYISTENMLENKRGVSFASSLPSVSTVPSFSKGQVLISNIRPYFKKIWLARFDGGRSNDVLALDPTEKECTEFLYNLLYQDAFFDFMMRTSKGAKMPRGDKNSIAGWKFVCSDHALRSFFSENVHPYYLYIESLNAEMLQLSLTRDILLPKLLSGEIDLSQVA